MIITLEKLDVPLIIEIENIINDNYAETAHFDIPLDIDWNTYLSIDNSFKAFVMRDDGAIVGILFFVVAKYPHIRSLTMAQQVTFYVKPEYRKHSLKMIKESEVYFTDYGINLIIQSARYDSGFCKVLEAKNYEQSDVQYTKRIN